MSKFFSGLLIILFLALACAKLKAGERLDPIDTTSFIIQNQQACIGDTLAIAIRVEDFTGIEAFQFSLSWDAGQLELLDTCNTFCPGINYNAPQPNQLVFTWLRGGECPASSLPDGDTLLIIKMGVLSIGPNGNAIAFGNLAPPEVVARDMDGNTHIFRPFTADGLITFSEVHVEASATLITCMEPLANLEARDMGGSGSLSFEWFFGGAPYAGRADTLAALPGAYSVVAIRGNCADTATVEVLADTLAPGVSLLTTTDTLSCIQTSVVLESSSLQSGLAYSWLDAGGNEIGATGSIQLSQAGAYSLSVLNPANGCDTTLSVQIFQDTLMPSAILATSGVLGCNSAAVALQADALSTNAIVSWSDENGQVLPRPEAVREGTYYALLSDTISGCTFQDSVEVAADFTPPGLALAFQTDSLLSCLNTSVEVLASATENTALIWANGQGDTLSGGNLAVITQAGDYVAIATAADNGCETAATLQVYENRRLPNASINLEQGFDCMAEEALISTADAPDYQYQWTGPSGAVASPSEPQTVVLEPGTYHLLVTDRENGCAAVDSIQLTPGTDGLQSLSLDVVQVGCNDDSGTGSAMAHSVAGGTAPYLFALNGGIFTEANSFTGLAPGAYSLLIMDARGCEYDTTFIIQQAQGHQVQLLASEGIIQTGDSVNLSILFDVPDEQIESARLFTADSLLCDSCRLLSSRPRETATYFVESTDINGCKSFATVEVRVNKTRNVYIPNAFSPNGDEHNDFFKIYTGPGVSRIKQMNIFDKWGGLVYAAEADAAGLLTEGWDGTVAGEPLDSGIFVYIAEIEFTDARVEVFKGEVMLVK